MYVGGLVGSGKLVLANGSVSSKYCTLHVSAIFASDWTFRKASFDASADRPVRRLRWGFDVDPRDSFRLRSLDGFSASSFIRDDPH